MSQNLSAVEGSLRAIGNRVLVTDMYFGEQVTESGIIISSDDGKTRGVYPRWGKVYRKGPLVDEPYDIGDWILVEHGRWTRGINLIDGDEELEVRMIETESVLGWSDEKPEGLVLGNEYSDGETATVDPGAFINQ